MGGDGGWRCDKGDLHLLRQRWRRHSAALCIQIKLFNWHPQKNNHTVKGRLFMNSSLLFLNVRQKNFQSLMIHSPLHRVYSVSLFLNVTIHYTVPPVITNPMTLQSDWTSRAMGQSDSTTDDSRGTRSLPGCFPKNNCGGRFQTRRRCVCVCVPSDP